MTSIYADADTGFVMHQIDDVSEVFELAADDVPLAGHCFEDRFDEVCFFVCFVQGGGYSFDCFGTRSTECRTGTMTCFSNYSGLSYG